MKPKALLTCFGISAAALVLGFSRLSAADPATPVPPPAPEQQDGGKGGRHFKPDGDRKFQRPFHRPGGEHGFGPGQPDDHMMLNLTDEQKAKVKQIMDQARPKIDAIRQEEQAKIKVIMDDVRQQIRPLLTPGQQQVMDNAQKVREDMEKLRESQRKLRQDSKKTE